MDYPPFHAVCGANIRRRMSEGVDHPAAHSIHGDAATGPRAFLEGVALPPSRRQRLFQARRRIEAGGVSAVSLDVFDTLLWRRVPRPTDAFLLLGHRLAEDGELQPWLTPAAFRRLRIEAERRARVAKWHAGGGVEATLEEIWEQIPSSMVVEPNPDRMASTELDLERRITQPDLDVVDFAAFAAESGCQLALVSNTYFTNDKLARLLARSGLEVFHKALLFASCSFGVGKTDGLWDIVLSDLGVAPGRVIHVGDDVAADVEVPRAHGVRPYWYPRVDEQTEAVFAREGLLPEEPRPPAAVVDPVEGDLGLTGLRAKVGRRADAVGLPHDFAVAVALRGHRAGTGADRLRRLGARAHPRGGSDDGLVHDARGPVALRAGR